ncbi:hypothetical protein H8E88_25420 [candidate division KSB1 bacterium]|nr:hypothetical protein [candidate division KSB1 bacterium]MBL7095541.1 hypothetical protein [candidate division KSB1 bacterium]
MKRKISIKHPDKVNPWVRRSIDLIHNTNYFDKILEIYPLQISAPVRLDEAIRRKIIMAHQSRNTGLLLALLKDITKFPYDEPIWYILKNVQGCFEKNPKQIERIAKTLYEMTAEETVIRIESAPKLNTQIGPMFNNWIRKNFNLLKLPEFQKSRKGIHILDSTEEEGKSFMNDMLRQNLYKRPDLVVKVKSLYIIGEAKWIGQPGGNQGKQVQEVLQFCKNQRGDVIRIGIIDGFPWAVFNTKGNFINDKEAVTVQESEYDIISALLLSDYLNEFTH